MGILGFQLTSIMHIWSHMHFNLMQLILHLFQTNVLNMIVKIDTKFRISFYQNIMLFKPLMHVALYYTTIAAT